MDLTRIKDAPNYQGENEGFICLNNAIWKKAVIDEFKKAKAILYGYVFYEIGKINGRKVKKQNVQQAVDIVSPELLKTVRENIYKESQIWPYNSRKGHNYGIYKAAVLGIVKELMGGC